VKISFILKLPSRKYIHRKKGHCDLCHKYSVSLRSDTNILFYCAKCIKDGAARSAAVSCLLDLAFSQPNQPTEPSQPLHSRKSRLDRWRCVIYHLEGIKKKFIRNRLRTTYRTINRWINQYVTSNNDELKEKKRRGRKRKLSNDDVNEIVNYTKKTKFVTPASIKFRFSLKFSKYVYMLILLTMFD
jgi:transposase